MTTSDRYYHNESGEYWYKKYVKCNRENEQLKQRIIELQNDSTNDEHIGWKRIGDVE